MRKHPHSSRYARLVAGFATSAFALLGLLSAMQHEANTVTASASRNSPVITNYRASENCLAVVNKNQRTKVVNNYRLCRTK